VEEMLCAMALKSSNGRQTHHTKAGLPVCREQVLKSEKRWRTEYTRGVPLRGPSGNRPRERSNTSGWREKALHGINGGDLAARPCAAQANYILLTGNTGLLREQQPLKALRAPCGPAIPQYKMLYYIGCS
jgi:hypothetical protein